MEDASLGSIIPSKKGRNAALHLLLLGEDRWQVCIEEGAYEAGHGVLSDVVNVCRCVFGGGEWLEGF